MPHVPFVPVGKVTIEGDVAATTHSSHTPKIEMMPIAEAHKYMYDIQAYHMYISSIVAMVERDTNHPVGVV